MLRRRYLFNLIYALSNNYLKSIISSAYIRYILIPIWYILAVFYYKIRRLVFLTSKVYFYEIYYLLLIQVQSLLERRKDIVAQAMQAQKISQVLLILHSFNPILIEVGCCPLPFCLIVYKKETNYFSFLDV